MKHESNNWQAEFADYAKPLSDSVQLPSGILEQIKQRIFPNPWKVFAKVSVIHASVGFLSLAVCNQFGLNPFQTQQILTDWFMRIAGHHFCMLLCGVFFAASTFLLGNLFLTLEEFATIQRSAWLQSMVIGLFSLAAFYFFGAQLVGTLVGLWFLGLLLGAFVSIEGSYRLRRVF